MKAYIRAVHGEICQNSKVNSEVLIEKQQKGEVAAANRRTKPSRKQGVWCGRSQVFCQLLSIQPIITANVNYNPVYPFGEVRGQL